MTDFKPIEIQDKPLFDEFLRKDPPQVSELTFTNLFIWRHHYQPAWLQWNECILILFHPQKGPAYGLCSFGPGDKKSALDVLCKEIAKQTSDVRICRVGEEFVTNHVDPAKYEVVSRPGQQRLRLPCERPDQPFGQQVSPEKEPPQSVHQELRF